MHIGGVTIKYGEVRENSMFNDGLGFYGKSFILCFKLY